MCSCVRVCVRAYDTRYDGTWLYVDQAVVIHRLSKTNCLAWAGRGEDNSSTPDLVGYYQLLPAYHTRSVVLDCTGGSDLQQCVPIIRGMFSAVVRRAGAVASAAAMRPRLAAPHAFRQQAACFSDQVAGDGKTILDTHETGRQREERESGFNREPIHPPKGSGTKAMPFEVPSEHKERVVGFEHPESHAMYWFPLAAGKLHYVEEIDRYFKLVPLS